VRLRRRGAPTADAADAVDAAVEAAVETVEDEQAHWAAQRVELINLCLYARDRVGSPATARKIDDRLAELGIVAVCPDGELFDPAAHEAGSTVITDDPDLHGLVASTEQPGYVDNGAPLQVPVVAVYRRRDGATS